MITALLTTFFATAAVWLTYRLLFRNSSSFQFNRCMLLVMTCFAFALPFIRLELPVQVAGNAFVSAFADTGYRLQEAVVSAGGASGGAVRWSRLIVLLYAVGVLAFLLRLGFHLMKIRRMADGRRKESVDGLCVVRTGTEHIPFSFLNRIFLPEGEADLQILKHEESHVRHHHTFDILFIEVLTAFQWFNPFMRLIKKDMQHIHEYTADRDVIDGGADKTDYMMLILQQCTASGTGARPGASTAIGNNFSFSLTKKRIQMITQKKKTKGLAFRALLTLPVFALLLFANCGNRSPKPESDEASIAGQRPAEVYESCEVMPAYPGGEEQLAAFIAENVRYPQAAKESAVEGTCIVKFVVAADGSVTDVQCAQSVSPECDEEALRVVKAMPKWTPGKEAGKAVAVQFFLPITFELS